MTERSPSVTIVFLVYNRREELRESLQRMLDESDYDPDRLDVIVVDNASTDGSGAMVREEFPQVRLIERTENIGVSGWNEGLAAARGDYVLALDDDCYLPPGGLRRAVEEAERHEADLVSFKVISTKDPEHVFSDIYRTGLFTFWGCAVLLRRRVVAALGGYDPEIFVWANELEFMIRFFDSGFRHLHLPDVVAQHMKAVDKLTWEQRLRPYRINMRHFAYVAAKLLKLRDAARGVRGSAAPRRCATRFARTGSCSASCPTSPAASSLGLRRREPVRNAELSRFYRHNFERLRQPVVDLAADRRHRSGSASGSCSLTSAGRRAGVRSTTASAHRCTPPTPRACSSSDPPTGVRSRAPSPDSMSANAPTVCAVVITHNRRELLGECLDKIRAQTRPPDHVLVVDNASTDGTAEMLAAQSDIEVQHAAGQPRRGRRIRGRSSRRPRDGLRLGVAAG